MELVREINDGFKITKAEHILKYVEEFRREDREHFVVLGLDTGNKVLYRDVVSIGTLNSSIVHPREVFKKACINSANKIFIVHNHPSGNLEPSEEDREIFRRLKEAGKILDIKVLDSVIIGRDGLYSEVEGEIKKGV